VSHFFDLAWFYNRQYSLIITFIRVFYALRSATQIRLSFTYQDSKVGNLAESILEYSLLQRGYKRLKFTHLIIVSVLHPIGVNFPPIIKTAILRRCSGANRNPEQLIWLIHPFSIKTPYGTAVRGKQQPPNILSENTPKFSICENKQTAAVFGVILATPNTYEQAEVDMIVVH